MAPPQRFQLLDRRILETISAGRPNDRDGKVDEGATAGRRSLSGSAPCRWYINEDLPEINELQARLKGSIPAVQGITLPGQSAAEISAQVDLETKTVKELIDLNIWDHAKTKFYCTVVITKLSPAQRWWFSACTTCNKGIVPYGSAYKCPEKDCEGVGAMPRYRICYVASDGADEVDLLFFEKAGKELIGKPALSLIRSKAPHGITMAEAIQFARTDQSIPRELAAIVSRKYRLVVSVTAKSFQPECDKPAYQVHRIDTEYGRQSHSSALRRKPGLALASSSNSSDSGLNTIGEALTEQAILGQASSSATATRLSDAPSSTDISTSATVSTTTVPQTPPSVKKPTGPSGLTDSAIKKALFQESPPQAGAEDTLETAPLVESDELGLPVIDDPSLPPAPSTTSSAEKVGTRRRQLPQKAQTDPPSKKKK